MTEKLELLKCQFCGKICDGFGAVTHLKCTKHNLWTIILPDLTYLTAKSNEDES